MSKVDNVLAATSYQLYLVNRTTYPLKSYSQAVVVLVLGTE